jgi:hypothetical protein
MTSPVSVTQNGSQNWPHFWGHCPCYFDPCKGVALQPRFNLCVYRKQLGLRWARFSFPSAAAPERRAPDSERTCLLAFCLSRFTFLVFFFLSRRRSRRNEMFEPICQKRASLQSSMSDARAAKEKCHLLATG